MDNKFYEFLSNWKDYFISLLSLGTSYMFYSRRKKQEQLARIEDKVNENNLDVSIFRVEIREIKDDIKEIKDWIFSKKR